MQGPGDDDERHEQDDREERGVDEQERRPTRHRQSRTQGRDEGLQGRREEERDEEEERHARRTEEAEDDAVREEAAADQADTAHEPGSRLVACGCAAFKCLVPRLGRRLGGLGPDRLLLRLARLTGDPVLGRHVRRPPMAGVRRTLGSG